MDMSELEELARKRSKLMEESRKEQEQEDSKRRAPMTKEEWEKQQSVVRREFDEDTGRVRLVKVSKTDFIDQHILFTSSFLLNMTSLYDQY